MELFDEDMMLARMLEIELRQATVADTKFLWDVFRVSMKDYITQTRGEWNEQREESQFRHQLAPIKGSARWIHTICIVPERQNRGIGTEVIRSAIAEAETQKMPLYLSVLKVNPARRLYERLGFAVIEETEHHFRMKFRGVAGSEPGV